jgi:hypothetical protein
MYEIKLLVIIIIIKVKISFIHIFNSSTQITSTDNCITLTTFNSQQNVKVIITAVGWDYYNEDH